MRSSSRRWAASSVVCLMLAGCASGGGGSATGLSGGSIGCPEGPRPTLDCRGVLSQFARDFRADLNALTKVQFGAAAVTRKLIEADVLSSDIIQHHYQTCSMYNACVLSREQFATRMERLHRLQLEVRRALGAGAVTAIAGQQNIQINPNVSFPPLPPEGDALPPSSEGAFPPPFETAPVFETPPPDETPAGQDSGFSSPAPDIFSPAPTVPSPVGQAGPAIAAPEKLDAVLGLLREGSKVFRSPTSAARPPAPATSEAPGAPPRAEEPDLDTRLRAMVMTLKQEMARRAPTAASAATVVGHFTQEGQAYAGPLGSILQERFEAIVQRDGGLVPSTRTRGVTIKEVAAVGDPNDPKALGAIYGSDVAITGTYKREGDQVVIRVTALDADGKEVAQVSETLPAGVLPAALAEGPDNAAATERLLRALERLGPKVTGDARVDVTTNRPGAGATFHLGEEIRYLVTSTTGGHLYLFHVDAEQNVARLFPNAYQRDSRVAAGAAFEIPPSGAAFRLEAAPPFGLETTVAIVTPAPLDERALSELAAALGRPTPESVAATRGIIVKQASAAASPGTSGAPPVWSTVTVLVRP